MNYVEISKQVKALSTKVATFIREELLKVKSDDIVTKEHNSLVTYVDQTAERMIVKRLQELLPTSSFITEEDTIEQRESEQVWIIDPLDGTTNFLQQIPHFAVSIALRVSGIMQIGVVYDVMREQCFSAVKGHGAFVNNTAIHVSQKSDISECMLATGFPYANNINFTPLINTLEHWMINARGIRRFGAAALDLCFVASGRIDCYYESTLNIWDIAAGILIVEEAGGKVSDYFGKDDYHTGKQTLASNGHIHQHVVNVLTQKFQS
jgi:myo-inositol-1(or 4)-monophosphatase